MLPCCWSACLVFVFLYQLLSCCPAAALSALCFSSYISYYLVALLLVCLPCVCLPISVTVLLPCCCSVCLVFVFLYQLLSCWPAAGLPALCLYSYISYYLVALLLLCLPCVCLPISVTALLPCCCSVCLVFVFLYQLLSCCPAAGLSALCLSSYISYYLVALLLVCLPCVCLPISVTTLLPCCWSAYLLFVFYSHQRNSFLTGVKFNSRLPEAPL